MDESQHIQFKNIYIRNIPTDVFFIKLEFLSKSYLPLTLPTKNYVKSSYLKSIITLRISNILSQSRVIIFKKEAFISVE